MRLRPEGGTQAVQRVTSGVEDAFEAGLALNGDVM
jgi:hypothetical protein